MPVVHSLDGLAGCRRRLPFADRRCDPLSVSQFFTIAFGSEAGIVQPAWSVRQVERHVTPKDRLFLGVQIQMSGVEATFQRCLASLVDYQRRIPRVPTCMKDRSFDRGRLPNNGEFGKPFSTVGAPGGCVPGYTKEILE